MRKSCSILSAGDEPIMDGNRGQVRSHPRINIQVRPGQFINIQVMSVYKLIFRSYQFINIQVMSVFCCKEQKSKGLGQRVSTLMRKGKRDIPIDRETSENKRT